MRLRLVPAIALLLTALLQATGAAGGPSAAREDVYRGTLQITVQYWGPKCPLRLTRNPLRLQKTRTFRMPVTLNRNPPAAVGVVKERNPFNFVVSTSPPLREAGIELTSATVTNDPLVGPTLYEYWTFSLRGSSIQGRLVRSFRETGLAANLFYTDRLIVPCRPELGTHRRLPETIKEGARLTGTISDPRIVLTVTGKTFDLQRRFTARITASR